MGAGQTELAASTEPVPGPEVLTVPWRVGSGVRDVVMGPTVGISGQGSVSAFCSLVV